MDTSKEYIKMCDCPEIQSQTHFYEHGLRGNFFNGNVWLPRQDQIQEMIGDFDKVLPMLPQLERLDKACGEQFTSMEQLWLAFYMSKKHKKTWKGAITWRKNMDG